MPTSVRSTGSGWRSRRWDSTQSSRPSLPAGNRRRTRTAGRSAARFPRRAANTAPPVVAALVDAHHAFVARAAVLIGTLARMTTLDAQVGVEPGSGLRPEGDARVTGEVVRPPVLAAPSAGSSTLSPAPMPRRRSRSRSRAARGRHRARRRRRRRRARMVQGAQRRLLDAGRPMSLYEYQVPIARWRSPVSFVSVRPLRLSKSLSRSISAVGGTSLPLSSCPPASSTRLRAAAANPRRQDRRQHDAARSPIASFRRLLYAPCPDAIPRPRFQHPEPDRADRRHRHRRGPRPQRQLRQAPAAVQARRTASSPNDDPRVKHSDPLMWVEALDLLLDRDARRRRRLQRHRRHQRRRPAARLRVPGRAARRSGQVVDRHAAGRPGAPAAVARDRADLDGQLHQRRVRRDRRRRRRRRPSGGAHRLARHRTLHRPADPQVLEAGPRRLRQHGRDPPGQLVHRVAAGGHQRRRSTSATAPA